MNKTDAITLPREEDTKPEPLFVPLPADVTAEAVPEGRLLKKRVCPHD